MSGSLASVKSDFLEIVKRVDGRPALEILLRNVPDEVASDSFVADRLSPLATSEDWRVRRDEIAARLKVVVTAETPDQVKNERAKDLASNILSNPAYRDPGVRQDRNWLSRSLDNLGKATNDRLERLLERKETRRTYAPGVLVAGVLDPIVWGVLIVGLIVFATFMIVKFRAARSAHRKRLSLLDDEEPDYTADEWLQKADDLAAQQKFREAVRCLYLASLTRLDEAGHLRFVRAETNWEHLKRFEANPNRPAELDLRTATREFDRVWYGYRVRDDQDVAWFRSFYEGLLRLGARKP